MKRKLKHLAKRKWYLIVALILVLLIGWIFPAYAQAPEIPYCQVIELPTEIVPFYEQIPDPPCQKTTASSTVIAYIRERSDAAALDTRCVLELARYESGFDPFAQNPFSSAVGPFQFLIGTWKTYCSGDPKDYRANVDCAISLLKTPMGYMHWMADSNTVEAMRRKDCLLGLAGLVDN